MEMFAEAYGWTPEQVRAMRYTDVYIMHHILITRRTLENQRKSQ